jgi:hypothetical protein
MYEVARRNPFVFAPALLIVAARFEEVAKICCEEEQKANCFRTKVCISFASFKRRRNNPIPQLQTLTLNYSK